MSMTPDHALAGEVRRAVASHLETHEAASAKELERMLAQRVAGYRPEPGSTALRQQLARLADGGHVHSVAVGGRACWKQGLDSSVYAPEAATVVRPGAMDFARIPSLLLGQRSGYWGTSR
jgi:hypothetical protein